MYSLTSLYFFLSLLLLFCNSTVNLLLCLLHFDIPSNLFLNYSITLVSIWKLIHFYALTDGISSSILNWWIWIRSLSICVFFIPSVLGFAVNPFINVDGFNILEIYGAILIWLNWLIRLVNKNVIVIRATTILNF